MRISDWSSDVCSSDLDPVARQEEQRGAERRVQDGGGLQRQTLGAPDEADRILQHVGEPERKQQAVERVAAVQGAYKHARYEQAHDRRDDRRHEQRPPDSQAGVARIADVAARRVERSEEHTSELQSIMRRSDADFFSNKK